MSTRSIINRAKLEAWASRFAEQKASGLTVADWCQQNNISKHSYFYWKRRLKDEAVSQALPEIVPLAVPPVPVSVSNSQVLTPVHDHSCKSCTSCASCTTFATDSCVRTQVLADHNISRHKLSFFPTTCPSHICYQIQNTILIPICVWKYPEWYNQKWLFSFHKPFSHQNILNMVF